jgi:hypothetical protein
VYALVEPQGRRFEEGAEATRREGEVALEQSVQLQQWLLVEGHRAERLGPDPRSAQAEANGMGRKASVPLEAGEPLLLGCRHDLAVGQQAGGAIVIEGRDPENELRQG